MALASVVGCVGSAKANARKVCLRLGDSNSTSLDLFGTLSKRTGWEGLGNLRSTRSAKVTVALPLSIRKMGFASGNGYTIGAKKSKLYLMHADNNSTGLDLIGTQLKRNGWKASAI